MKYYTRYFARVIKRVHSIGAVIKRVHSIDGNSAPNKYVSSSCLHLVHSRWTLYLCLTWCNCATKWIRLNALTVQFQQRCFLYHSFFLGYDSLNTARFFNDPARSHHVMSPPLFRYPAHYTGQIIHTKRGILEEGERFSPFQMNQVLEIRA